MHQKRDFLIFLFAVLLLFGGWYFLKPYIYPDKPVTDRGTKAEGTKEGDEKKPAPGKLTRLPDLPRPTPDDQLIRMGSDDPTSDFEMAVAFDPLGAGVRSILLNRFRAADSDGKPIKGELLELVP